MSTRSSIWLGESKGTFVNIYRELAEREMDNGGIATPIYIAVDAGNADEEVAIRLPKEIAVRLLMILSPDWGDEVRRVLQPSERGKEPGGRTQSMIKIPPSFARPDSRGRLSPRGHCWFLQP